VQPSNSAGTDDEDRVVSRRVDRPTRAEPEDEAVYEAAEPVPDDRRAAADTGPAPPAVEDGTTERAADEMRAADEGEPTRSE
jgi:hypothetical protein